MKKLFTIMVISVLMAACNDEAATTDSTTESADTMMTSPATVDTLSSDTTRINADSAIRK